MSDNDVNIFTAHALYDEITMKSPLILKWITMNNQTQYDNPYSYLVLHECFFLTLFNANSDAYEKYTETYSMRKN